VGISVDAAPVAQTHQLLTSKRHMYNFQNLYQTTRQASLCFVLYDGVFHDPIGHGTAPQDTLRELAYNITNFHVAETYGLLPTTI
jgi:hypothetical protein